MIRGLNKITKSAGLGYLMSSYTAHNSFDEAETDAKDIAARLMTAGLVVFAPIAYGPGIERYMASGAFNECNAYIKSHEFWMPICERFFERCDYGIIATTPGWHKSEGIAIELAALSLSDVPVWFYDTDEDQLLTIDEAATRFEDEMEELMARATEKAGKYLTSNGERESKAVGETIRYLALAALDD